MHRLIILFAVPLLILNWASGLIGGIGLAIHSEWRLLFGGLAYAVLAPFALSIVMMPGLIFAPLAARAMERGNNILGFAALAPSMIWTYAVVSISCISVFAKLASISAGSLIHLMWAYSISTAPWSYLAQKDMQSGNENSGFLVLFIQMGVASMILSALIDPNDLSWTRLALWFLPFMGIGLIFQLIISWEASKY